MIKFRKKTVKKNLKGPLKNKHTQFRSYAYTTCFILFKIIMFSLWISGLKACPSDCKTANAMWKRSETCKGTDKWASGNE